MLCINRNLLPVVVLIGFSSVASAEVLINEVLIDPSGADGQDVFTNQLK